MLSPPSTIQSFACFCQINEVCRFCTYYIALGLLLAFSQSNKPRKTETETPPIWREGSLVDTKPIQASRTRQRGLQFGGRAFF